MNQFEASGDPEAVPVQPESLPAVRGPGSELDGSQPASVSSAGARPSSAYVDRVLSEIRDGKAGAVDELFEIAYAELYRIARRQANSRSATMNATALVSEACAKLLRAEADWVDQAHFHRAAARAMKHALIDHSRRKKSAKRCPPGERIDLDLIAEQVEERVRRPIEELAEALAILEKRNPTLATIVELRFFCDYNYEECARIMNKSAKSVQRWWADARAWLRVQLLDDDES